MKNYLSVFIAVSFLFFTKNMLAQTQVECLTPTPTDMSQVMSAEKVNQILANRSGPVATYNVRVMFHLIRYTDGSNGPTVAEVQDQVNNFLNPNYAAQNIAFVLVGTNNINNTSYATTSDWLALTQNTLYPAYGSTDRLDIFVFPSTLGDIPGYAFSIPGDYLAMSQLRFGTSQNLSHEVGHCLGLFHTHEVWGSTCPSIYREQIDGGNCTTGGDLCCDTAADPNLDIAGFNSGSCTYTGGTSVQDCEGASPYVPPFSNYMSYGWTCRNNFTTCQRNRMQAELTSGNVGPLMLEQCPAVLTLSGTIGNGVYTASDNILSTGTVNSGSTVTISAGNYIRFTPGATISSGSSVGAKLQGCAPTLQPENPVEEQ